MDSCSWEVSCGRGMLQNLPSPASTLGIISESAMPLPLHQNPVLGHGGGWTGVQQVAEANARTLRHKCQLEPWEMLFLRWKMLQDTKEMPGE